MEKPRRFEAENHVVVGRKIILTIICTLFLILLIKPESVYAQIRVSMDMRNATLPEVFKEITRITGYEFMYSSNELPTTRTSVRVVDQDLKEVMANCLKNTKLGYVIDNKVIVISPKITPPTNQSRTIKGVVRDEKGFPLHGVSVQILHSSMGVMTDRNGTFVITVEQETPTLVFSCVGKDTRNVVVSDSESNSGLDVIMRTNSFAIEEVVVTGYGEVDRFSFTGSSTSMTQEDLKKASANNILKAIQIFDPGFRISPNNLTGSNPNALPIMYIRGQSGLDGVRELDQITGSISEYALVKNPNLPIFILDGFEVSVEKIYDLDINIVQDLTILKDASATAMYGSRAANGVIVIRTISPGPGKLRLAYNYTATLTAPDLSDYNLMNASQKIEAELAAGLLDPIDPVSPTNLRFSRRLTEYRDKMNNILRGVDTYWMSQPLHVGFNNKHSVYIDGGEESVRFSLGLRYENNNGVMKKSFRNIMGAEMKIVFQKKGFILSNMTSFDRMESQESPYGSFTQYVRMQPYYSPWDLNTGELVKMLPGTLGTGYSEIDNPMYEASLCNYDKGGYNKFTDNLMFDWAFLRNFKFKAQFAITFQDAANDRFIDPASSKYNIYQTTLFERGELFLTRTKSFGWNTNLLLSYSNSINDHSINALVGFNAKEDVQNYSYSHFRGFSSGELNTEKFARDIVTKPTLQDNHTRLAGILFQGNYTYRSIYLADLAIRFDGSSEFGTEKRYAPFWAAGTGVNIHNYEFMRDFTFVSMLRLKGNYGQTGKVDYPPYAARNSYQLMLDEWHTTGIGATLYYMGNTSLRWSKTNELSFGIDFSLFQNRFYMDFSYYDKRTIDLITDVTTPSSAGFTTYKENMGEVLRRGFEIKMNVQVVQMNDFDVNVFANGAHLRSEILKISNTLKEYNDKVDSYYNKYNEWQTYGYNSEYSKPILKYEEGGSLTSIFGMKSLGISPANGKELFLNRDGSVTYDWDPSQQQIIGNTEPKMSGSFGFNVRFKQFTLFTSFLYEFGGQYYNQTLVDNVENLDLWRYNGDLRVFTDRWQKPGDITPLKSIKDRYRVTRPTSRFIQDNNFISFNSLMLQYDFDPSLLKRIGLSKSKLVFNMNDVARFSSIKTERGIDYPFARTFSFTFNANF